MSFFTSLIIVILATLIQGLMQLPAGIFSIFYHRALGKKSQKNLPANTLFFVLGTLVFNLTIITILCIFIFSAYHYTKPNYNLLSWIKTGILFAESVLSLFFYYRGKGTTELFISRTTAKSLKNEAEKVKTRFDAFVLGFMAGIPELFFTLPLYITVIVNLINISVAWRTAVMACFLIANILPLFSVCFSFRTGHNLAEITKFRLRIKPFIRVFLCASYLLLAIFTLLGAF